MNSVYTEQAMTSQELDDLKAGKKGHKTKRRYNGGAFGACMSGCLPKMDDEYLDIFLLDINNYRTQLNSWYYVQCNILIIF